MKKELTLLIIALISSSVCLSACKGAKKAETSVSETSVAITTVSDTTQNSETETATEAAPDGGKQDPGAGGADQTDAANTVSAEYNAEVGASYPMRYENNAVYCHDPSTGEKKTGYIRINGITYFYIT